MDRHFHCLFGTPARFFRTLMCHTLLMTLSTPLTRILKKKYYGTTTIALISHYIEGQNSTQGKWAHMCMHMHMHMTCTCTCACTCACACIHRRTA